MTTNKIEFDRHELQSSAFKKIVEYIEVEIASLQKRNEGDLDPVATAKIRGQIKFAKGLLSAAQPTVMTGNVSGAKKAY